MSVTCKQIEEFPDSVFHRFLCHDVLFDKLKLYKSTQGNQRQKRDLRNYISDTALTVKKHNKNLQGLSLPGKITQHMHGFSEKDWNKWLLGYHGIESYDFLFLRPYNPDLDLHQLNEVAISDLPKEVTEEAISFDFRADSICIWPRLITMTTDYKAAGGYIFSIPDFFLKPMRIDIEDFEFTSIDEPEKKPNVDIEQLYFSLYYDASANLLYFKNRFIKKGPGRVMPDFIHTPKGCEWSKSMQFSEKSLLNLDERFDSSKWVSG